MSEIERVRKEFLSNEVLDAISRATKGMAEINVKVS